MSSVQRGGEVAGDVGGLLLSLRAASGGCFELLQKQPLKVSQAAAFD